MQVCLAMYDMTLLRFFGGMGLRPKILQ